MSIVIKWSNPSSAFNEINIFRSDEPFTDVAVATLVAVIMDGSTEYEDVSVVSGSYYYRLQSTLGDQVALSSMVRISTSDIWTPAELFGASDKGFFYNFTDKSSLRKSRFGTLEVDSTNEVRVIQDKSPNNWDMGIASNTAAHHAVNIADGLSFSTTSGFTPYPAFLTGDNSGLFICAAIKSPTTFGAIGNGYDMGRQLFTSWVSGTGSDIVLGFGSGNLALYCEPGVTTPLQHAVPTNTKMMVGAHVKAGSSTLRFNGSTVASSPTANLSPRLDGLCAYSNSGNFLRTFAGGEVYAALAIFRQLTDPEVTSVENWMLDLL